MEQVLKVSLPSPELLIFYSSWMVLNASCSSLCKGSCFKATSGFPKPAEGQSDIAKGWGVTEEGRTQEAMPAKALLSEAVKPPDSWVCSAGVLRSTPGSSEIQVSENSTSFIAGDSGLAWGFRRKKTRSRSPCEKWSFVHGKEHKRRWLKGGRKAKPIWPRRSSWAADLGHPRKPFSQEFK